MLTRIVAACRRLSNNATTSRRVKRLATLEVCGLEERATPAADLLLPIDPPETVVFSDIGAAVAAENETAPLIVRVDMLGGTTFEPVEKPEALASFTDADADDTLFAKETAAEVVETTPAAANAIDEAELEEWLAMVEAELAAQESQ